MLIVLLALRLAYAQYTSYNAVAGRLPGRCLPGDFDCGFGRCVPVTSFHDGKPDCYDGSDEWCFFGQVKCGAYCVDVSQAFSCLFSSRCDDSNRQPPWCSVSKEKLCGEPSAFPCRGYGECVLWPWLLDGEKHCIDGSDEDQLYVRALEFSFRCYYNRTRQVAMPPPLNYTDTFLKLTNPNQLPDIRPPQFPTLFPPLSTLPSPDLYLTSSPSFTQPPPVQLSKITGLPPLPPPFPTLLPPTPPSNPSVIQLGPNPIVPTEQTVLVPDSISSPDDPFVKLSRPLSTSTQAPSSPKSTYSPNYNSNEQESQSPLLSTTSSTTPSTAQPPSVKTVVIVPTKPHVRGRLTTRPWSLQSTTSGRLTHIQVVTELITSGDGDLIASSSGQGTTEREREKQGMSSSGSKPDRLNTLDPAVSGQATATPPKTSAPGGYAGVLIPLPDESAVNPKFRTTIRPQTSQIDNDHSDQSLISSSSSEMNSVRMTDSNTATSPAPSLPNPAISGSVESGSNNYSTTITPTTITTTTTTVIPTTARNLCLTDLITTSQNRYSSRECQCPTGEMLLNEHCEASEGNLAFYKLNIQSACGEETLTPDQKKWIAIGKLGETTEIPSCVRLNSNGDVVVNSMCGSPCTLEHFQKLMQEKSGSRRSITVEEAPLCVDASTNYCHANAECSVEDVQLICRCKPGTNDTSNGLGKICEGTVADDDCIMIFGACLIFWLIILLGLLVLIPLLLLLLFRCCPRRDNSVHPKKSGGKGKKGGKKEGKHIAALMSNLLAANAGGQREMAMKMAMAELDKKDKKKEKSRRSAMKQTSVEDAKELTSATVINHSANSAQRPVTANGMSNAVREIESIPGTVQPHVGETPILDKVNSSPAIAVQSSSPQKTVPEGRDILAMKSASQQSLTVPEKTNTVPTVSTPSIVSSPPIMQETSVPVPAPAPTTVSTTESILQSESYSSPPTSTQNPLQPAPTPPPAPQPPPPTFPAAVEVHRNDETNEPAIVRQVSTHSIGIQPTIWESYKALGDQYAKQEEADQESCSSSLEALIQSRYPEAYVNAPIGTAPPPTGKPPSADKTPPESKKSPDEIKSPEEKRPSEEAEPPEVKQQSEQKEPPPVPPLEDVKSRPATQGTLPSEEVPGTVVAEGNGPPAGSTLPSPLISPKPSARSDKDVKLNDTLTVPVDEPKESAPPTTTKPTDIPQTDEQIVEEISRQGVVLPTSPHDIPALSLDRVTERPESAAPAEKRVPKETAAQRQRPRPKVPNVHVESERVKRPLAARGKPSKPAVPTIKPVFVPKKAREQQKGKVASKKPAPLQKASKGAASGSRQLLSLPEGGKHSSTDESEAEIAAWKRLEQLRDDPSALARRRKRQPERQLSSISEKSAEIAAEAALQNQPQDFSISAPNTTRSLSEWHHYVRKKTSGDDASESTTDIDIPRGKKFRLRSKSKAAIDRLKKKRTEPFAKWEPRETSDQSQPPRRRRICEASSSDTSSSSAVRRPVRSHLPLVPSPDIPDVTLRRSMDRLDQLEKSASHQGAMTSRSHIGHRASAHARARVSRPSTSKEDSVFSRSKWDRLSDPSSVRRPPRKISVDTDLPSTSSTVHHHSLISRKIAIRRHEMKITKSTSDLTVESHDSRHHLSRTRQASRSADNLLRRPPWDSSPYRPDEHLHSEPFLPRIKARTKPQRKCQSMFNSPRGSVHRSTSKFSLTSLPIRSSSTFELSPYFTPGENSGKPPKENLWWTPGPRSFR